MWSQYFFTITSMTTALESLPFSTICTGPQMLEVFFATEETFALLREKFVWCWENVPLSDRVTNPAKGRYPDACFDGFLVRGAARLSCKPIPTQGVSDHFPVVLTVAID